MIWRTGVITSQRSLVRAHYHPPSHQFTLSNDQLIELYDSELVLRLRNVKNLSDTRKILARFMEHLGNYPPSAELAKGFLAPYADRQPRTLYRYAQMVKAFMKQLSIRFAML